MAEEGHSGLGLDLEKELTCSICTDLLFQPLTLLDCLHTYCGACLKEWFQFQASTAQTAHPYTCPSCRASVRTTQPNATVTTLLDMFVKANPGRGKSDTEKNVDREKYKPGDNVLPKLRRREEPGAEDERRVLEEVQQLSLREVGIPSASTNLEPPREGRRRRTERSRDGSRSSRDSRMRDERSTSRNPPEPSSSREIHPARQIEHQSSLRSLLSSSELDSQEIEEEIMRQIMEEGLLDGIDLNNIDVAQEDEISERIAQAYRRRQEERRRERRERRERLAREGRIESSPAASIAPSTRSPLIREDEQPRRRTQGRSSESGTSTPQNVNPSSRPPVSRPGLIDAANRGGHGHHRRSSSQGSSRSSHRPAALSITSNREAASSAGDLGERPAQSGTPRRMSDNQQRGTFDERQQFRNNLRTHSSSNPNSPRRAVFNIPPTESPVSSTAVVASPLSSNAVSTSATSIPPPTSRRTTDPTGVRQNRAENNGTPPTLSPATFPRSSTDPATPEPHSRASSITAPTLFVEPAISCKRCGKEHIEHELHYNCSICDKGEYNICLGCYRGGRGCKHWFGFGWGANVAYDRQAPPEGYSPNHERPHILIGHRYRRPLTTLTESIDPPHNLMSEDDPSRRVESGAFCDICKAYANACYWKCDTCNQGDWGYCNDCINQGHHCTHPLLPLAHTPKTSTPAIEPPPEVPTQSTTLTLPAQPTQESSTTPPLTPKTAALTRGPGLTTVANLIFRPLTFTTECDICKYPIPPINARYHCLKCNKGDYDICMNCYHKLLVLGRISKEDGMNGWRRCLRGHRMVVVGFEDRDTGQRRVIVRDLVGGFALRDEGVNTTNNNTVTETRPSYAPSSSTANWSWRDTDGSIHKYRSPSSPSPSSSLNSQRFPPDGGVGLRFQAQWSYFPDEGDRDELAFPKHAEIREAEDINGDWFWGVYAGVKGLFPSNYGKVVGGGVEGGGWV